MFKINKILLKEFPSKKQNSELLKENSIPELPISEEASISYRRHWHTFAAVLVEAKATKVYTWDMEYNQWILKRTIEK